jgi:hypothetical protein
MLGRSPPPDTAPEMGKDGRLRVGEEGRAFAGIALAFPNVGPAGFGREMFGRDTFELGVLGREIGTLGRAPPLPNLPIDGLAPAPLLPPTLLLPPR